MHSLMWPSMTLHSQSPHAIPHMTMPIYPSYIYFEFLIGMHWERLGLTIPPSFTGTLSSRSKFMNLSHSSSVFLQVASSAGRRFHLTRLFATNWARFFTHWWSKIASGLRTSSLSSVIGGKSTVASIVLPTFFLAKTHGKLDAHGTLLVAWVYRPLF